MNHRSNAPRNIPVLHQFSILFSHLIQQIGLAIMAQGLFFFIIFSSLSEPLFRDTKDWVNVSGVVDKSEETNTKENKKRIYAIYYTFLYQGVTYHGISYKAGGTIDIGRSIKIIVNPKNPNENKAEELRSNFFGGGFSIVLIIFLILPLIGSILVGIKIPQKLKSRKLLVQGIFTRGKLNTKTPTNSQVKINNKIYPIYKYVFEYEYLNKTYTTICKTHKTWLVEDEELETILFDPNHPEQSVIYDAENAFPIIDKNGTIQFKKRSLLYLLLPIICIGLMVTAFITLK